MKTFLFTLASLLVASHAYGYSYTCKAAVTYKTDGEVPKTEALEAKFVNPYSTIMTAGRWGGMQLAIEFDMSEQPLRDVSNYLNKFGDTYLRTTSESPLVVAADGTVRIKHKVETAEGDGKPTEAVYEMICTKVAEE